ncbi:MAG TPA: DNA repair protein RadA [Candidatus Krumholzibacteria bacterium]|nr:DNA repair protein RadA [Candidatus Krumholzibacteria bacterium]
MAKDTRRFQCSECEHVELRWMGRCPSCGAWNSLQETRVEPPEGDGAPGRRRAGRRGDSSRPLSRPTPIDRVPRAAFERRPIEPEEFSRVLGGGLVPGSLLLLGGAPGVGKSTLLTMICGQLARRGESVVYLSAEESGAQVRARAERLGATHDAFLLVEQPVLERVLPGLYDDPPALLVVDSIQTVISEEHDSTPGLVSQIRTCGSLLADFARTTGCAVVVVGHVTKDGDLAGPRVLEHLVDTVLYFEPQDEDSVRMVRAFKNRFGRTGELAVLEMTSTGLRPVRDASALFLSGRRQGETGSAVSCIVSGTRPLLVEVQALLVSSQYGTPTRVVTGIDTKRVAQLAAILEARGDVQLIGNDVYVKVAGGLRLNDPAADLSLLLAMASSLREVPLPSDLIALGEVGLTGELRRVGQLDLRLEEARAHGFRRALVAAHDPGSVPRIQGIEGIAVSTVRDAIRAAWAGATTAGGTP